MAVNLQQALKIIIDATISKEANIEVGNEFHIYPNPAADTMYVTTPLSSPFEGKICTTNGTVIKNFKSEDDYVALNIGNLMEGNYILHIQSASGENWTKSFIKNTK